MIDVANQAEAMTYMLGGIVVLFVVTYFLVTGKKESNDDH